MNDNLVSVVCIGKFYETIVCVTVAKSNENALFGAQAMTKANYEITPRDPAIGGGWKLRVLDSEGIEVAGGVFPLSAYPNAENSTDEAHADALAEAREIMQGNFA
jgi:hypothetical protein